MFKNLLFLIIAIPAVCMAERSDIADEFTTLDEQSSISTSLNSTTRYHEWAESTAAKLANEEGLNPTSLIYTWEGGTLYVSTEQILCKLELRRRGWITSVLEEYTPRWTMKKNLDCLKR